MNNGQQSETHIERFVGDRYAFYQRKWQQCAENKHNPSSWNGAAFFFGVFWMLYRKMYKYALIVTVLLLLEGAVEEMLNLPDAMSYAVTITVALLFGFYGNTLYQHHVNKKVHDITTSYPPEQFDAVLQKQGGGSWVAVLAPLTVLLLLVAAVVAYSQ